MSRQLVLFLEEPSASDFLQGLLPRLLPAEITIRFIVFDGKQDLEKQLPRKLRGWLEDADCRFVVLRDRDAGDCRVIKNRLSGLCQASGKEGVLVRIACRELESWHLGDLAAVDQVFQTKWGSSQKKRHYRNPDELDNPHQVLCRLVPAYQKISGSRELGKVMDPERNVSPSFQVFLKGIYNMLDLESPRSEQSPDRNGP
ncbi:MAG: DUF4276 family protein [Magnetococcales bacterium]|nr:DUF4276 family protein [Magnetococcales bacterium]